MMNLKAFKGLRVLEIGCIWYDDMAKIVTPCKQICELDEIKQICKTCKRTDEEIANWLDYTPAERKAVMKQIKDRLWQ